MPALIVIADEKREVQLPATLRIRDEGNMESHVSVVEIHGIELSAHV